MRNLGIVSEIKDDGSVTVTTLNSAVCINCMRIDGCSRSGKNTSVRNPKGFALEKGNFVRLDMPPHAKKRIGVIAFLFPLISTVAGFALSPVISAALGRANSELFSFSVSLVFFLMSAFLSIFLGRKAGNFFRLEITHVL